MGRFKGLKVLLFIVALLLPALTTPLAEDSIVSGHPMIGSQAPAFELESTAGNVLSLAGWKGRFVVLHFGASW